MTPSVLVRFTPNLIMVVRFIYLSAPTVNFIPTYRQKKGLTTSTPLPFYKIKLIDCNIFWLLWMAMPKDTKKIFLKKCSNL